MGFERIEHSPPLQQDTAEVSSPEKENEDKRILAEMQNQLLDLEKYEREGKDFSTETQATIRGNILQIKMALRHNEIWPKFLEVHGNDFREALYAKYPPTDKRYNYNLSEFLNQSEETVLEDLEKIIYH